MKQPAKIIRKSVIGPRQVRIEFASGEVRDIDFTRFAKPGTVFEPLADPVFAAKFRIVDYGFAIRWPGGLDFSAGSLKREGKRVIPESTIAVALKKPVVSRVPAKTLPARPKRAARPPMAATAKPAKAAATGVRGGSSKGR